jgi:hypothetical protein
MRSNRWYERQLDKAYAIIERQNDRIMYLCDRPWTPPPVAEGAAEQPEWFDSERYAFVPEHDVVED